MAITKQQGEVRVYARIVATDTAGAVLGNNLTLVLDEASVNGIELGDTLLAGSLASEVSAVNTALKALFVAAEGIAAS